MNIGDVIQHQYPRLLKNFKYLLLEPEMIHAGPDEDNVEDERVAAFKEQLRRAVDCMAGSLPDLPKLEAVQEEIEGDAAVAVEQQKDPKLHTFVILSLCIATCTIYL